MVEYIRSRSPLRIGIAGGGTDVEPYMSAKGGRVFNTTINKYAYCTLLPKYNRTMSVHSVYYGTYKVKLGSSPFKFDGNMDLIKAVANHFDLKDGFDITIHSDAPAGSGLGGSSTMLTAMIAAVANWTETELTKPEMAHLAYVLEREKIGLTGGKQDQYATVFGGFNVFEFTSDDVKIKQVKMDPDMVNELQYRSVLCFTGMSRESAKIIKSQIESTKNKENVDALDATKKLASIVAKSFEKGDFENAGKLLDEAWSLKKQFTKGVSNRYIDKLYSTARENGAIGGKVSGAGGGGFMYFICEYDKKPEVAEALKKKGAIVSDFMFEPEGVIAWRSKNA